MVSVSMFDTDKLYFDSMSALERIMHELFEICTSDWLFGVHVVTTISPLQAEKIFI